MVFGIYKTPESAEQSWGELKTGDIPDPIDFEYTRYFCGVGTFSLTVPRTTLYADEIEVGCILILHENGEYSGFIIKNIKRLNDVIKITGNDLNGLLADRLTVAQTEDGKDAQSGATETIVKHYVSANCTEEAVDVGRGFPCLVVAEDLSRGTQNDAAAPRLARVSDTIADILSAAKMGYRITPMFNGSLCKMEFDVIEQTDRTSGQRENSAVCFAYGHGNVSEMTRETGVTSDRNTFYCQLSDGLVTRYDKKSEPVENEEAEPAETTEDTEETTKYSGYQRREEYLDLNCELSEIEVYADHQIADRFQETDSLEIVAGNPLDYGTVYNVGDVITVYDRARSVQLDSVISATEIKRTATEYSVKITLGSSKPKPIDKVNKTAAALAASLKQPVKNPLEYTDSDGMKHTASINVDQGGTAGMVFNENGTNVGGIKFYHGVYDGKKYSSSSMAIEMPKFRIFVSANGFSIDDDYSNLHFSFEFWKIKALIEYAQEHNMI